MRNAAATVRGSARPRRLKTELAGLEQSVAAVERGDDEVMQTVAKISVTPRREETADYHALLAWSICRDKAEPNCWAMTEPATCSAEIVSRTVRPSTAPTKSLAGIATPD